MQTECLFEENGFHVEDPEFENPARRGARRLARRPRRRGVTVVRHKTEDTAPRKIERVCGRNFTRRASTCTAHGTAMRGPQTVSASKLAEEPIRRDEKKKLCLLVNLTSSCKIIHTPNFNFSKVPQRSTPGPRDPRTMLLSGVPGRNS